MDDNKNERILPIHRDIAPNATIRVRVSDSQGNKRNLYVTLCYDGPHICAIFSTVGKQGGEMDAVLGCLMRIISKKLQKGASPENIAKNMIGYHGEMVGLWPAKIKEFGLDVPFTFSSTPDAIGMLLKNHKVIYEKFIKPQEQDAEKLSDEEINKALEQGRKERDLYNKNSTASINKTK